MAKTSPALATPLRDRLEKLAAFDPQDLPVVSLYLNLAPDQHGRDSYDSFVRKAFTERLGAFDAGSDARASLERDAERIKRYLADEVHRSSNGLAIFAASAANDFFEAIQLDAAVDEHRLFIGSTPHLYPLVRLIDQYPRYAAVVLDTYRARIFVFSLGSIERRQEVTGVKTRRHSMGGWSQARYQRHADNVHLHHVREVVDALDAVVRTDDVQHIVIAGDEVVVPLLREQLPAHLIEKVVDVLKLDTGAAEDRIVQATLDVLRQKDAETDAEKVAELVDAWQSNGLGVVGPEATLAALQLGQVDELIIAATPQELEPVQTLSDDSAPGSVVAETTAHVSGDDRQVELAEELVTGAQRTAASVRFIEDSERLRELGGVGALLRFRI